MEYGKKNTAFCPASFDRGAECDCTHCSQHQALYDAIKKNPKWLTISPPDHHEDPTDWFKEWNDFFWEMRYFAKNILGVCELANMRQHFHLCYETTDNVKEFKMLNKLKKNAQVKILKGYPRGGIHYLFKDIQDSIELMTVDPIITDYSIHSLHQRIKREKRTDQTALSIFEKRI